MDKMDKSQKRVNLLINELADNFPAIAVTLNKMKFCPTKNISTAACDYKGNGIYNPDFFNGLTDLNIKAILIHESLHLYFNHFKRFCKVEQVENYQTIIDNSEKYYGKLKAWNIAADSFINEVILKELPVNSLPDNVVTFTEISKMTKLDRSFLKKSCTEEIYNKLLENQEQMQQALNQMISDMLNDIESNGGNNNNSNSKSNTNDGNKDEKNNQTNADQESESNSIEKTLKKIVSIIDKETQDIIDEVYQDNKNENEIESLDTDNLDTNTSKSLQDMRAGNSSNHQEIDIVEKVVSVTNIEWKEILSEFVYNISGKANSGRTWHRPSKRYRKIYPISQGRMRKTKTKDFTFAIDVSGSMDKEKISNAFDVILNYAEENDMSCKYYFWSTNISEIYNFSNKNEFIYQLKKHYGGGTDLTCALNNYDTSNIGEGLIVVTDLQIPNITVPNLHEFNCPIVFLDIEPYGEKSDAKIIEESGNKYAKIY